MEVDARAQPRGKPAAQPPAQTHARTPDGGETQATAPLWEYPTGTSSEVYGGKNKQAQGTKKCNEVDRTNGRLRNGCVHLFITHIHKTCS